MSKQLTPKPELSTTTVEDLLPTNFDKLSAKQREEIIVNAARELLVESMRYRLDEEKLIEKKKILQKRLKESQLMKELNAVKKELKHIDTVDSAICMQFQGILIVAKKLGIDMSKYMRNFKIIDKE